MGAAQSQGERFPLLAKLLDAREKLSLQVHPPPQMAAEMGGEPKTEVWYIAEAAPGAELYVGLKRGVTRAEFERRIRDGTVAGCFHPVSVKAGDAMFLPSGRVHAIGSGLVIFEIQQNSDTTYRVFDWNRVGLDGKPRELHIQQSLQSIDFSDYEPSLVCSTSSSIGSMKCRPLVQGVPFTVEMMQAGKATAPVLPRRRMQIVACLSGHLRVVAGRSTTELTPGGFCLVPACLDRVEVHLEGGTAFLRIESR
jgi:mannose-6-phosphate isomerase